MTGGKGLNVKLYVLELSTGIVEILSFDSVVSLLRVFLHQQPYFPFWCEQRKWLSHFISILLTTHYQRGSSLKDGTVGILILSLTLFAVLYDLSLSLPLSLAFMIPQCLADPTPIHFVGYSELAGFCNHEGAVVQ